MNIGEEYWSCPMPQNGSIGAAPVGRNGNGHHSRLPFEELSINASFPVYDATLGTCARGPTDAVRPAKDFSKATRQEPLWQPTRLTSPYCVLSANGVEDDYYSSCLSWGCENVALALRDEVLLFQPTRPMSRPAVLNVRDRHLSSGSHGDYQDSSSRITAVSVSRFSDTVCFLGGLDGTVGTYASRGDGQLVLRDRFAMPPPPLEQTPLAGPALHAATASVRCLATTNAHPWLAAAGTAAQGLFVLDGRCRAIAARMAGCDAFFPPADRRPTAADAATLLAGANGICGVAWNASGSLIAAGGSDGVVEIWAPAQSRAPVQRLRLPGAHTSVKAVAFHPVNPYELVVGGGARDSVLRVFDVSAAAARVVWSAPTDCQVTQALYSSDGSFIVSAHGAQLRPDAAASTATAAATGTGTTSVAAAAAACSLVMWRKGTQPRRAAPVGFAAAEVNGAVDRRHTPLPLVAMYAMAGHRSRPLHLAAPFSQSASQGCMASVAGGVDSTIRFWQAFCARSEAVNWEQRTRASLRAATTDEDVDGVMARPLR